MAPLTVTTRPADISDVEGILTCALAFPHYRVEPEAIAPLIVASIAVGACWVACRGSQVVGFLVALVLPHPFSGRPYLDVLAWWVLPDWRISGAGLGLVRKLLRFTWTEPLELVRISTSDARIGAFLRRVGFRAVETTYLKGDAWHQFLASSAPSREAC